MENGQAAIVTEDSKTEAVTKDEKDATVEEVKSETPVETENAKPKIQVEAEDVSKTEDGKPKVEDETDAKKEAEVTPQLLEKIRKQIEFYFGDVNMQKDKFLIEQTKLSDGWMPMDVMLKFKLLAALSQDSSVIVKALESSELIEVSEDKTKIRRSLDHPLPTYDDEYRKTQQEKTVYVKGFPLEGMTIDILKEFFVPYEPIDNIYMRKYADKEKKMHFKGSVFVQFKTLDNAKSFMEKEGIKYEETELIKKWTAEYNEEKQKEKEERRQKKNSQKGNKKSDDNEEKEEETVKEEKKSGLPKGSILHFSEMDNVAREDIKEALAGLDAKVAYVDFARGDTSGYVRLVTENEAKTVFEKLEDGKLKLGEKDAIVRVLEGDEENEYLEKAQEEIANLRRGKNNKHNNKFKGGRKNRFQRGQKRRGDDRGDEVMAKRRA